MPMEQSAGKPTTRRYSDQERAAAVRMVRSLRAELGTEHGTVHRVATQLGYGVESVPTGNASPRSERHPIGTIGDSYDNTLAETVNGYYKAELIRGPARQRPWKSIEDVELATLGWVHWHNTQRLHGYLGDIPPAEFEQAFYADQTDHHQVVGIQ